MMVSENYTPGGGQQAEEAELIVEIQIRKLLSLAHIAQWEKMHIYDT